MKNVLFLLIILSLPACTQALWERSSYTDDLQGFFVSENGDNLAFISKRYHYIFPVDDTLKSILLSAQSKKLHSSLRDYEVDNNNEISGEYSLRYSDEILTKDDEAWLKKHNFKESNYPNYKNKHNYIYYGEHTGTRYRSKGNEININNFTTAHSVKIITPKSGLETVGKIALTPLTVAADGTMLIGGIAMFITFDFVMNITGNCNNPDFCQ